MKNKPVRIILDTNIWISYLISGTLKELDSHIEKGYVRLLFSRESMEEFLAVTQRPRLQQYFSLKDTEAIVSLMDTFGEYIEIKSNVKLCSDPKDDFLLNLAIDGKADLLVTGDQALLKLNKVGNTQITTPPELLKALK